MTTHILLIAHAPLAEALKALRGQVTVLVVTHRTTLVQHVDKMLVLEAGKAQHYGPSVEVMRAMQQKAQQAAQAAVAHGFAVLQRKLLQRPRAGHLAHRRRRQRRCRRRARSGCQVRAPSRRSG